MWCLWGWLFVLLALARLRCLGAEYSVSSSIVVFRFSVCHSFHLLSSRQNQMAFYSCLRYINFYAAFSYERISFIRSTEKSPLCCVSRCLAAIPSDTLPKIEKWREKNRHASDSSILIGFPLRCGLNVHCWICQRLAWKCEHRLCGFRCAQGLGTARFIHHFAHIAFYWYICTAKPSTWNIRIECGEHVLIRNILIFPDLHQ